MFTTGFDIRFLIEEAIFDQVQQTDQDRFQHKHENIGGDHFLSQRKINFLYSSISKSSL